ncbi:MAG: hypothetical protein CMJ89_00020 [Planctomycetes bacterium]|nr:hypothetical protein [Planctomycetota bacterium]
MNCTTCGKQATGLVPILVTKPKSMSDIAKLPLYSFCRECTLEAEKPYLSAIALQMVEDQRSGARSDPKDVAAIAGQLEGMHSNGGQTTWACLSDYYGVE